MYIYLYIWGKKILPTKKGDSPILTNFPTSDETFDTRYGTLSTSSTKLIAGVFRCLSIYFHFLAMGDQT